jgi:hypothetical protein
VGDTGIYTEILEIWDTDRRFGEDFPWEVQPDPWEIQEDTAKSGQDIDRYEGDGGDPGGTKRDSREIQEDPRRYKQIRERYRRSEGDTVRFVGV